MDGEEDALADAAAPCVSLATFLNGALGSNNKKARRAAYQCVALAAARCPSELATPAAGLFARAAAGVETDPGLRSAAIHFAWECVAAGGAEALEAGLPSLADSLSPDEWLPALHPQGPGRQEFVGGWRRACAGALKCLGWSEASVEGRAQIALSLAMAKTRHLDDLWNEATQATQGGPEASSSGLLILASSISDMAARSPAVVRVLVLGAVQAAAAVVRDPCLDLEQVLSGTAPPCELRDAVAVLGKALDDACRSASEAPYDDATAAAAAQGPRLLWNELHALVCAELARTDQQGYAACLVQWLLSNEETTAQEYDSSARVGEGVSEGMEESADVDGCDFGSINSDELEFDPGLPSCFP
mmetsp:Transcript_64707/g.145977  ORF Transcript_64707/g.145977 Transcript_64707/m.145977 type:complete len:360 (-) Transcript_64707:299-1378(-)